RGRGWRGGPLAGGVAARIGVGSGVGQGVPLDAHRCRSAGAPRDRRRGRVMRVRALDVAEDEAFRLGRMLAIQHMPYWARALFAVTPLAAPDLATFAVDGRWRLYMDPALLTGQQRWGTPTVAAVLLHEIGHLLRDHAGRARSMPVPLAHTAWNFAGDAEI